MNVAVRIKRMKVREIKQHAITPAVFIVVLTVAVAYSVTFIPSSVADANLRIVLDSPKVRRLLVERGKRDQAVDGAVGAIWHKAVEDREQRPILDMVQHPEKYTAGRSQDLEAIANEPSLTLPKGTYLWTFERSTDAKCNLDVMSTTVFEKVRIVSWRHHSKEGWTCGPVRPLLSVP